MVMLMIVAVDIGTRVETIIRVTKKVAMSTR